MLQMKELMAQLNMELFKNKIVDDQLSSPEVEAAADDEDDFAQAFSNKTVQRRLLVAIAFAASDTTYIQQTHLIHWPLTPQHPLQDPLTCLPLLSNHLLPLPTKTTWWPCHPPTLVMSWLWIMTMNLKPPRIDGAPHKARRARVRSRGARP